MSLAGQQSHLLAVSPLKLEKRETRDAVFSIFFMTMVLASAVFGVVSSQAADLDRFSASYEQCNVSNVSAAPHHRHLRQLVSTTRNEENVSFLAHHLWALIPMVATLVLIGLTFVQLLKHCATTVVYATIAMIPLSFFLGGAVLYSTNVPAALLFFAFAALWCALISCCRRSLALTARLLECAAEVLITHPSLVPVTLALLVGFLVFLAGCIASLVGLFATGEYQVVETLVRQRRGGPTVRGPPSCELVLPGWASAGIGLVSLTILWAGFLLFTLRFFVVALTTSIWYFDASAESGGHHPASAHARRAPVRTALRLAFSRSFGSLCYSALVLTICSMLKAMAEKMMRQSDNLFVVLVACCLKCVLQVIEFLNKFAVCMLAISGDDFCTSARHVKDLLGRHGLSMWFVDRISSLVLSMASFALAALAAGAMTILVLTVGDLPAHVAGLLGAATGVLAFVILSFLAEIVLNVVDASFTCFALDIDGGAAHQPALRDALIPKVKPDYVVVVAQPGSAPPVLATAVAGPSAAQYAQHAPPPVYTTDGALVVAANPDAPLDKV